MIKSKLSPLITIKKIIDHTNPHSRPKKKVRFNIETNYKLFEIGSCSSQLSQSPEKRDYIDFNFTEQKELHKTTPKINAEDSRRDFKLAQNIIFKKESYLDLIMQMDRNYNNNLHLLLLESQLRESLAYQPS